MSLVTECENEAVFVVTVREVALVNESFVASSTVYSLASATAGQVTLYVSLEPAVSGAVICGAEGTAQGAG